MDTASRNLLVLLLCVISAACARGPDTRALETDLQARLDAVFGRPVLVLRSLNRQGSAPYPASNGTEQAIVYFNSILVFAEVYNPSDWEGLSPQLIADALGATDEGLLGLASGPMKPGTELRVYGSMVYHREGDQWRPARLPARQPSVQETRGALEPSPTEELIRRVASLVETTPAGREIRDQVVADELDRALENIRLRLDLDEARIVVAAGPAGGEYARFVASIATRLQDPSRLNAATTAGSVENAFLVERGNARFALVQSDVAAAAAAGRGLFSAIGALKDLRAIASLFPEPVHVVVRADAGINTVTDLAGRRVTLGGMGSGSRHTALEVLAAHGLPAGSYVEQSSEDPADALKQVADGQLDALIAVVSAPWAQLSRASAAAPLKVLALDASAIERIATDIDGILPLSIPARTYAGQSERIPTVSATALLVASKDLPDAIVTEALQTLFGSTAQPGPGAKASRLSRDRALLGINIPLHPGAKAYFDSQSTNP